MATPAGTVLHEDRSFFGRAPLRVQVMYAAERDTELDDLVTAAGLELVDTAHATPEHAIDMLSTPAPDFLIVDLGEDERSWILCVGWLRAAGDLRQQALGMAILLLCRTPRKLASLPAALFGRFVSEDGAPIGIRPKDELSVFSLRQLAAEMLIEGRHLVPAESGWHLVWKRKLVDLAGVLTTRERDVLGALVDGNNHAGVATQLGIAEKTVENTLAGVYDKLSLRGVDQINQRMVSVMMFLAGTSLLPSNQVLNDEDRRLHIYAAHRRALGEQLGREPSIDDFARSLDLPLVVVEAALGTHGFTA